MQLKAGHATALKTHAATGFRTEDHTDTLALLRLADQPQTDHLPRMDAGLAGGNGHQLKADVSAVMTGELR